MAQVRLARRAHADLDRLAGLLHANDPDITSEAVSAILDGLAVPERHPLIGTPVELGLRELVISRGKTGYVALCRFVPERGLVRVLSIRLQREVGYED